MGVQISEIVEAHELNIDQLFDKKIAVDAFNWIYQFLSIIRQPDGQPLQDMKGRVTSHFSGLFYRNMKLIGASITPIYVFDGKPPDFKRHEAQRRRDAREEAKKDWEAALAINDYENAKKYAKRSVTITEEIITGSKQLLDAMGIGWVQAPSEGEALASMMCRNKEAYATATQDFDSLLFGCPRVVRNLSISGKKKRGNDYIIIEPELLVLDEVLESLKLSQEQFVCLGIIVGTDFNPGGIKGYGPKKAFELVRGKSPEAVFSALKNEGKWDFDVEPEDIFDFFMNPPVGSYTVHKKNFSEEAVTKLLVDEYDFSQDRIESAIKKLKEEETKQKSLNKWFR